MRRDWLVRARSCLLVALAVEVLVLLVTGVALYFLYRPEVGQAWTDLGTGVRRSVSTASLLRDIHRLTSTLAFWTSVAVGALLALRASAGRRWVGPALGAGVVVTTFFASFTGYLLPWDQLALSAVTVGSDLRGFSPLFRPVVRFVLIGGVEVSPGTVLRWLFVHVVVLGPALAALLVVAWRRVGQRPTPEPAGVSAAWAGDGGPGPASAPSPPPGRRSPP
ncbi:MAG TPA: cytochrome b N-terminal domain-containing protein, partial [Acidimicrobiales bacterium]|nr:cytochrome b N-terminal domain-containing protein [Acidimicrobiales bacterium]